MRFEVSKRATVVVGIGAGLAGSFLLFHAARTWWATYKLNQLRKKAINGEISAFEFLQTAIGQGIAPPPPGAARVTIDDAKRMQCTALFPFDFENNAVPGFLEAIDQLRRSGECL